MQSQQDPTSAPLILITEDDPTTLQVLGSVVPAKFPKVGVLVAENGRVGLELFRSHTPDIVITDINMPLMNGIDMAREIKLLKADTKLIILSAYSDQQYAEKLTEIGVEAFILKPVAFSTLFAVIAKCLSELAAPLPTFPLTHGDDAKKAAC